jgi:hypothetical protein
MIKIDEPTSGVMRYGRGNMPMVKDKKNVAGRQ